MIELIKITERDGKQAVSARELYTFLEIQTPFTMWAERMFEYGFTENVDYVSLSQKSEKPQGGRPQIDYALSISCAKEISMLQRNDKGKQARQYFIEAENKYRELQKSGGFQVPQSFSQALLLAAQQAEQIEKQQLQISVQQEQIETMNEKIIDLNKKADYLEIILQSKETVTTTQIAQDYGMSARTFNKLLSDFRIQRKVNGQWILYNPYNTRGYVHSHTTEITHKDGSKGTVLNTEWRQSGRIFLYEFLKNKDILPLIEKSIVERATIF